MKFYKYLYSILFLLTMLVACKKEDLEDVSFAENAAAPGNLSALLDITQDNTGTVTITPNGEGVAYYQVYYGDNTSTPAKVTPGKSATHRYQAEGNYTLRILGIGINGTTTEATQPLTVSFRAPENLEVNAAIDNSNPLKVNVSATADYETVFKVYFGDVADEVPQSFLEGETISHVYAQVGKYNVRVVALSGGVATTELTREIEIVNPVLLPLNFENTTLQYRIDNFDGGHLSIIDNPNKSGINTSARTGKMVKGPGGQGWGGSVITLSEPIDFSANKVFMMKVFSPRVGAKVLLKVENISNGGINYEKEVTTTVANDWEDLAFDYRAINTANSYQKIVLIFELGTVGDGTSNFTFLFDDIRLTNKMPASVLGLPLTFENPDLDYTFTNFDGGEVTRIANPNSGGINTSATVMKMVKKPGQPWGGAYLTLDAPIDFSVKKTFKMKVFSPKVGGKVLLKVENLTNGGIGFEKELSTTKANEWEELTFDYSTINTANTYQKVVLIFDLGTQGDGSANFTYLFDDITLN